MKDHPFVSVIVPNYNHSSYLDQRIQSILAQDYTNYEILILDDFSSDDSLDVIDKYCKNPHFSQLIKNERNSGSVFKQWQKGISLAKGELIWIAESDDYCEQSLLSILVSKFVMDAGLSFAYSTSVWVDDNGDKLFSKPIQEDRVYPGQLFLNHYLLFDNSICNASSALCKAEFAKKCILYTKYVSSGDYMFWVEMAVQGSVCVVNKNLNYFRRHPRCLTGTKMSSGLTFYEDFEIWSYLKGLIPFSRFRKKMSMLYKQNILLGCQFDNTRIKNDVITLWGGPMNRIDWLLLKLCRKLNIFWGHLA